MNGLSSAISVVSMIERIKQENPELYQSISFFSDAMTSAITRSSLNGYEDGLEEAVCRLLAADMPVEEIAVVLNIRADKVRLIQDNNAATRIPDYAKKLKARRKRREKK